MPIGRFFHTIDSVGLVFLRLGLGIIFVAHGSQKLFGWFGGAGYQATIEGFQNLLGIPMQLTLLAMIAEFFGGLAILMGFMTRAAALGLASVMVVAMAKVHWAHGFFLNAQCLEGTGHGIEFNLALLAMALTVLFSGPGCWSLDKWISER